MNRRLTVMGLCAMGLAVMLVWPAGVVADGDAQAGAAKNPILVLETAKGTIEIELRRQDAPQTVEYIIGLVKKNFYRGLRFHRVERSLVQVGDPTSRDVSRKAWWGKTGTTPTVGVEEFKSGIGHVRGAVGLAHSGNAKFASSQFYIMKAASPGLNGKYTIFGRVTSGMAIVDGLQVADVLKLATIREK
ncbi:MAG: peptidylprolyl isomerase [Acidobacteria bacterium]|nr:peptidylprolyl isomerase [Acidobacteriota bacterium]